MIRDATRSSWSVMCIMVHVQIGFASLIMGRALGMRFKAGRSLCEAWIITKAFPLLSHSSISAFRTPIPIHLCPGSSLDKMKEGDPLQEPTSTAAGRTENSRSAVRSDCGANLRPVRRSVQLSPAGEEGRAKAVLASKACVSRRRGKRATATRIAALSRCRAKAQISTARGPRATPRGLPPEAQTGGV